MILEAAIESPNSDYQSAELRILPTTTQDSKWQVELRVDGLLDTGSISWGLDLTALSALEDPHKYGRALGQSLFSDGVLGPAYRETLAAVSTSNLALRLRLRLDSHQAAGLHWERLYHPEGANWEPVATTQQVLVARHVRIENWQGRPPLAERPLRLLAVIASPGHLPGFGLDPIEAAERKALHELLDALPDVTVTYLESGTDRLPSLQKLRSTLQEGYHIVHFLCHGALLTDQEGLETTVLYLENEAPVTGEQLVNTFNDLAAPPLLCFLAACESAKSGRNDAFVPLGPRLVARGKVQTVVAMSERVGLETARHFTGQFYEQLMKTGIVDLAMNSARQLVQEKWDWGAPVLYCSQWDNLLVEFPASRSLSRTGDVMHSMAGAVRNARANEQGARLVAELERVMEQLQASFRRLVDLGTELRGTGVTAATFPANFDVFYVKFKDYYDGETFLDEEALVRQVRAISAEVLPALRKSLSKEALKELKQVLDNLVATRSQLVLGFGEYLESMNSAVEEIQQHLLDGDVDAGIRAKREFEMKISSSLKLSKSLLRQASHDVGLAQAA